MLPHTLLLLSAAACLVWLAAVDVRERRIPNGAVLALCLGSVLQMALAAGGLQVMPGLPTVGERVVCSLVLVGASTAFELVWRRLHAGTHGMGMGDVKLLGACAFWVGSLVVPVLCVACVLALSFEVPRGRSSFAFGPYIALAFGACLLLVALPWDTLLYVLE